MSRRTAARATSGTGRSVGVGVGGCSYISNVRPENRSTLCSVIARLAEETQPSFEATLKSRAVSENCDVKFSCVVTGHPAPQLVWYKDDTQLDRFCGLPKYEIFRNGTSHSLHIYNCTAEDAAIYQASASNAKGIVSCSGVLEVGEMNEFKIHQRYFAKLKQKGEHRRRETAGKENLEPLSTVSPERSQRKRRSAAEALPGTPSSAEDEEENPGPQEATEDDVDAELLPVADGEAPVDENVNETHAHDAAHQPKTPSVKKKIRISNGAKADDVACEASLCSDGPSDEVMEVGSIDSSPVVPTDAADATRKRQERAAVRKEPPEDERVAPSPREQFTGSTAAGRAASAAQGKQAAAGGRRPPPQDAEVRNRGRHGAAARPTASALPARAQRRVGESEEAAVVGGSPLHGRVESEETCEQAGGQLSEKDVGQKNASVSRPTGPSESAQARTTAKRNDAPVGVELPPGWRSVDARPLARRAPPKREAATDDTHVFSSSCGFQAPVDKMCVDQSEADTVVTVLHTAAVKSPDGGEETPRSQVDMVAKSGETVEMKPDEETESKDVGVAPNKRTETESTAPQNVERREEAGSEKSEPMPDTEERSSASRQVKPDGPEPVARHAEKTNELEEVIEFKEIPRPVSKVVSVAELLRAQLKAVESTLMNPVSAADVRADFVLAPPASAPETRLQSKQDDGRRSPEEKKSGPDRKTTDDTNTKATLMEIYRQLNTDSATEPIRTRAATRSPVQASQSSASDPKAKESEPESARVDYPVASGAEMQNVRLKFQPVSSPDEPTGSRTESGGAAPNRGALEQAQDEPVRHKRAELLQNLTPGLQVSSGTESGTGETSSTTLGRCKTDDRIVNSGSLPSGRTEGVKARVRLQQDGPVVAEVSPRSKDRNCVSPTASATEHELASGARRKNPTPRTRPGEATETTSAAGTPNLNGRGSASPPSLPTSPSPPRTSPPLVSRRRMESRQPAEGVHAPGTQGKPAEKTRPDPFKAPQVIRKVRSETFSEASGHLKLWCQFFNVLSDSTVTWHRNGEEIARMSRKAGDETRVNLAIVQTSCRDCGVYRCSITNEHGTDSTELPLSSDILAGLSLCEDLGVGEEIEMTPLIFSKGVADAGVWGDRLFGRVVLRESHVGDGRSRKAWRAKVIYGLEPVFESGDTCVIKAPNPIGYGGREESGLVDRNLETVEQGCRIQNLAREYCKIFSAESRLVESFGPCLEVIPVYMMYRPANAVPYATVEAELAGAYQRYSLAGRADAGTGSWAEQKCCALQHWVHQWTNGNLLLTRLEGVDTKITNVGISVKSTGHRGLTVDGDPGAFERFVSRHRCNYFCGLLGLRSLKVTDNLSAPTKPKASRSPLLQRKAAAASSSPQSGRSAAAAGSPRLSRKAEQEGTKTPTRQKDPHQAKRP